MRASGMDAFRVTGWIVEGTVGRASVKVITPTPLAAAIGRWQGESISPEPLTQLFVGNWMVMSDTRDEYRDHAEAIFQARGRVLIHGLGLGCFLKAILAKSEVTHVDVVEIEQDVIDLIGPYFASDPRVVIHQGDAYAYQFPRGTRWDISWHDIWGDKNCDDLEGHARLSRRYGGRVEWQGCWAHHQLLRQRRWEKTQWWSR